MILCNDLHKQFGDVEAVKGVSMEIPDGMFLGLLGPNGAGKTTLMRSAPAIPRNARPGFSFRETAFPLLP